MDEIIFLALSKYYHCLELKGYISKKHSYKLLLLCFYKNFVFNDYRGLISKEDYRLIEKALDCIYGTSCLIPYPDYLKMGKLHLGEVTELAERLKILEDTDIVKLTHDLANTDVVKVIHNLQDAEGNTDSDILVMEDEDE